MLRKKFKKIATKFAIIGVMIMTACSSNGGANNEGVRSPDALVIPPLERPEIQEQTPIERPEVDLSDPYFPESPDLEKWRLIWSDEFDGDSLNLNYWEIMTGTGGAFGLTGWGNDEAQYYHGDNISVENGFLRIEARIENRSSPGERASRYTSARIRSIGPEAPQILYGRIEARISMPQGAGLWPAFWMLPINSPYGGWAASGEIDIMEVMGRLPRRSSGALHFGGGWPNNVYDHGATDIPDGRNITDFNVYAIEWEPEQIRWYVNDLNFFNMTRWHSQDENGERRPFPAPFDVPFHVLLNLAVGGHFDPQGTAALNDAIFPAYMYVDYVRVYEQIPNEVD